MPKLFSPFSSLKIKHTSLYSEDEELKGKELEREHLMEYLHLLARLFFFFKKPLSMCFIGLYSIIMYKYLYDVKITALFMIAY